MLFRRSEYKDIEKATELGEGGKVFLRSMGVSQWQRGNYPSREVFLSDVEEGIGYVVEEDGTVVAVCAVTFTPDASYGEIEGAWLTDGKELYATIHRSVVDGSFRGKGIMGFLIEKVAALTLEKGIHSIRIDTHEDNKPMQKALDKAGFQLCGRIILKEGAEVGDPRLAYELLLPASFKKDANRI